VVVVFLNGFPDPNQPVVPNMDDDIPIGQCLLLATLCCLAIAGLVMVSFAGGWYWPGIVVFIIGVVGGLYAVKRYYDREEWLRPRH
jgi:hypothetical protein